MKVWIEEAIFNNVSDDEEINSQNRYNKETTEEEFCMSDFIDALDSEITRKDLAMGYLAAFFNGRT